MSMVFGSPIRLAPAKLALLAGAFLSGALNVSRAASAQVPSPKPSATVSQPASPLSANEPTGAAMASQSRPTPPEQQIDVQFADGKVSVDATNAGLNQVLHEIGTKAGIKITGSVTDERVFGRYGPAKPAVVLAALLDGTQSNLLLVDDAEGAPELILTKRVGGPTPPNPNAVARESSSEEQPERPEPIFNQPNRPYQQFGSGRNSQAPPPANLSPDSPSGDSQQDQSLDPSNPKTAQQIYEQLQRTNQQQRPGASQTPQ